MLIPESHTHCTFENFDWSKLKNFKKYFDQFVAGKRDKGLVLIGNPGLGKTHLMVATFKEMLAKGHIAGCDVLYADWNLLLKTVREMMQNKVAIEDAVAKLLPLIVIIDDIKPPRGFVEENTLRALIENIYEHKKLALLSTNADSAEDLSDRWCLQDYWASRLFGSFELLVFKGDDWRLK